MARYRAVLLDLDGTLVDSQEDLIQAVAHGFEAIGFPAPAREVVIRNVGKPLIDFPHLLGFDFTDRQRREFTRYYRAYYSVHCGDHTKTYPGVRETLERIRAEGFMTAVITTKSQDQAEGVVRTMGLARYFDVVRGWREGEKFKPDPEPLVKTLKVLSIPPTKALMVGDSEQDVLAAQAAGVDACACLYGYRERDQILSLSPTFTIDDFPGLLDILLAKPEPGLA